MGCCGKGAAYGTCTLPTIESEVFIPALVAYSWGVSRQGFRGA